MSLFRSPEEHAANPPETWRVRKVLDRCWHLTACNGDAVLKSTATRREAIEARETGFLVNLYRDEKHWYAGGSIPNWRPYSEIRQEQAFRFYRRFAA